VDTFVKLLGNATVLCTAKQHAKEVWKPSGEGAQLLLLLLLLLLL
jgi:hypothetical protein